MRAAWTLAFLAAAVAVSARAETPQTRFDAEGPVPAIRMSQALVLGPAAGFVPAAGDRDAQPVRPKGTVQTAVDHRFSERALGSLGYLCGLGEMANASGGVASSFEPMGTFLGGQFKLAF